MTEVQSAAGGAAELLMECDEDEQEVWPRSPERDGEEEEEEEHDEELKAAVSPMEEETNLPAVRIVPLPVEPVSSCSPPTHHNTLKSSGAPLGFKLNGRLVRLLPGGGAAELKLRSHPGGSASGFTTVQVHSPAQHDNSTSALTATTEADPTPIITGVVSGEAAQKVLSGNSLNFLSSPPLTGLLTPSSVPVLTTPGVSPLTLVSPMALATPWIFTLTTPLTLFPQQTIPPALLTPAPASQELLTPGPASQELLTAAPASQESQTPAPASQAPSPGSPATTPTSPKTNPASQTPMTGSLTTTPAALTSSPASQTPAPPSLTSTPAPLSQKSQPSSSNIKPAAPPKLKHKGQLGPVSPPDCPVCMSQYKLITELRGFMCLCSPAIAQSLKNLKRKTNNSRRRSRDKTKSKVSKTRPGLSAPKVVSPVVQKSYGPSDDFLSVRVTSPPPPLSTSACGPQQQVHSDPPADSHGKLVIMVDDFYYGSSAGRNVVKPLNQKYTGPYRCIHCPMLLRNNIKLMSHMKQHMSSSSQEGGDMESVCPHCFRHFQSPFKLQCHAEAVHSQYQSTAKCKICELEFGSEAAFLWHMKSTHKPGEMPYACQVCGFRSSFYSDVWLHFHQAHADTKHLLCQYCLRVMSNNTCFQQHFARHQKKHVFGCDQCRLHFLYVRERIEHKLDHKTHVRPPQLIGLKPGTKVTVRTYSVVRGSETAEGLKKPLAPLKVVNIDPPPPRQEAPKRKPVKSLGPLLFALSQESVSRPSQRCVECLSSVQDFRTHFPSLVHCSLCRFITCCSTSYANHMINNHATCRKNPPYFSIFQSDTRLSQRLRCVSCTFTSCRGDVMANHLIERPEHRSVILTHSRDELNDNGPETRKTRSVTSSVGGAFIPIHLLPSSQTSTQLSVKALTSPSPLASRPAMTIKFLGPRPQTDQCPSPLSDSQLPVVLFSLWHGLPQASRRFDTSPALIRSWIWQQERGLADRKWFWRTDKLAEWVLTQREQQLSPSEGVLLKTARKALGQDGQLTDCYGWTVDFMLRHGLSLQPAHQHHRGRLPRSIRDNSRTFIRSLTTQIQSRRVPPQCVGSMDEFSIFIDPDQFSNQNPSSLQLFGSPEDEPVFDVVLSALFDGTFLPPLLFFRGTASRVPEGFPENVLLEVRQDGFTDQERLQIWINKVWRPHVSSQGSSESVLMVDVHRGHLTDKFRSSLTSESTGVAFIPPGCCCRLQPLDTCVIPVLRDFLQARWTQLVCDGGLDGLGLDQLALTLACWFSEVSSTLNSEKHILRRSFASVCNLQQVEDRGDAARMIAALTEALIQPPETPQPNLKPEPEPQMELLLVMEEQEEEQEVLRHVFDGESDPDSFQGFMDD